MHREWSLKMTVTVGRLWAICGHAASMQRQNGRRHGIALSPLHVPLQARRGRHGEVAIPTVAIGALVAAGSLAANRSRTGQHARIGGA
jgi:hypothetical protein